MPTPINRDSLNIDLATRYKTQKTGGAYDAKKPTPSETFGAQEKMWTEPGFVGTGNEGLGIKGTKKGQSMYLQGFSNKKYKP